MVEPPSSIRASSVSAVVYYASVLGASRDALLLLCAGKQMGRMHSGGKGISKSSLPYKRSSPSWLKTSAQAVTEHVCKLAKKGLTPSQVMRLDEQR